MNKKDEDLSLYLLLGFVTGMMFFYAASERKRQRHLKINKIKNDLNAGYSIDRENISKDWGYVYSDVNKSFKKLKKEIKYEPA